MKKALIQSMLALIIFGSVTASAHAAPLPAPPMAYDEECANEGCDDGELNDLWDSFQQECFTEGCWYEEVRELAGGDSQVKPMFDAFRTRLHKYVTIPKYRSGSTPTFWQWLCDAIGADSPGGCEVKGSVPVVTW